MAVDNDDADSKTLHAELRKLRLESKLRKNLSTELEKQKSIAVDAQKDALNKTNELEAISQQLSKYLSPQLYQSIFSGEQKVNRDSKRKKLTLFFSDLVSFTSISDSLESEEITSMLNYYLTEMSKIAFEYGGTIDKYVGDAIVIFFGDPETLGVQKDAVQCVKMAIAMQKRMQDLESEWAKNFGLRQPLEMRVGINTGYCTVGNFGSENRLDYTVIGGQVNLASRLESISRPGSILLSFDTYCQVSEDISCVEVEPVQVKGIRETVRVFEVILDGQESNTIKFETANLRCSVDLSTVGVNELDDLQGFVDKTKKSLR